MSKGFFVVYCTEALREPKLYKMQTWAIKRCMEHPKLTFKQFAQEPIADIFYKNMRSLYLQTSHRSCLNILQTSLAENPNPHRIDPPSLTSQALKIIEASQEKMKNIREKRQKQVNQIFLQGKLFKISTFKPTVVGFGLNTDFLGYFDGCSKGNPGMAGVGYHIDAANSHNTLIQRCQFIGSLRTNNQAELIALNLLLADAYCNNIKNLKVFGDSQLAIRFMTGRYKSHDAYLSTVVQSAFSLAKKIPNISFEHIARSFNAKADKLSNKALKEKDMREKKEIAQPNFDQASSNKQ